MKQLVVLIDEVRGGEPGTCRVFLKILSPEGYRNFVIILAGYTGLFQECDPPSTGPCRHSGLQNHGKGCMR